MRCAAHWPAESGSGEAGPPAMNETGRNGLWRATLTLLAGGALAQALPLLLGPWISRLYGPEEFGAYTAFWTVAANLAVVACLRYEFALPLERDEPGARALLALCVRLLLAVGAFSAVLAGAMAAMGRMPHAGWLPIAVLALGASQLATMWANRDERFRTLAASRVLQHGGGAVGQVAMGWGGASVLGLIAAPVAAAAAATCLLARMPGDVARGVWQAVRHPAAGALSSAWRRHRDFPLLNAPHAFAGALQDTLAVALLAAWSGDAAVGCWGLALRYLKAPATLVGGAVSQALYPKLVSASPAQARATVRQVMALLGGAAAVLALLLFAAGPGLFAAVFGERWRLAGELARALSPYIALHFVASPLAVVTMAWRGQAWALRLALVGQAMFLLALALGLKLGGLLGGAWAVSAAMALYFGYYFWRLATWREIPAPLNAEAQHAAGT